MLKYVSASVVFQEIPDEVTLAVSISNCPCHCPGCHSRFLWEDTGVPLTPMVLDGFVSKYSKNITCICFMGGDAEPGYINELACHLHQCYPHLKIGWYSGRIRIPSVVDASLFNYIKLGPYIRHLGGLKKQTTNQRMYKKSKDDVFVNITSMFWSE